MIIFVNAHKETERLQRESVLIPYDSSWIDPESFIEELNKYL